MEQLRVHEPEGQVVATSINGIDFTAIADGRPFAKRMGEVFRMADGSLGVLIGSVVFSQGPGGGQDPTYRLERGERRLGPSDREWSILS
jgi:hypothetical protein